MCGDYRKRDGAKPVDFMYFASFWQKSWDSPIRLRFGFVCVACPWCGGCVWHRQVFQKIGLWVIRVVAFFLVRATGCHVGGRVSMVRLRGARCRERSFHIYMTRRACL